jgi:hypothetical protein
VLQPFLGSKHTKKQGMAMVRVSFALALIVSICSSESSAQGTHRQGIMVLGVGTDSCGKWTRERRTETMTSVAYSQWVLGYVTGANAFFLTHDPHLAKGIDNTALLAWLDNYCHSNPLESLHNVLQPGFETLG